MLARKVLLIFCITLAPIVYAVDVAKLPVRHTDTKAYQMALIGEALSQSQEKFGPYNFITHLADLSSKRSFIELNKPGQEYINMRVGITSRKREENAIPIRLPIRKGLLSYKLLIINKKNKHMFDKVTTLDVLKTYRFGVVYDWITAGIMHANDLNVIDVPSYHGLFRMLNADRFDYTVLGVNEAFPILASLADENLDLMVAPNIALYINTPSYIFVSKSNPRLAERITWGLEKMIKNGRFDEIFEQYHQDYIDKVDLKNRTIISIPNPNLEHLLASPPFERKELWLNLLN